MFDEKISFPNELPVNPKQRKSTDVCCTIIGALFALTMFILACVLWNRDSFNNRFFGSASGSNGAACNNGFSYAVDPDNFSQRSCVNSCPGGFFGSSNGICLPNDEALRSKYMNNPEISQPWDYEGFKTTLFWSVLVALSFGMLWMTFVHCCPKVAPIAAFVGAIILMIALGVLLILASHSFWGLNTGFKILMAIFCFLLAIILIAMLCMYSTELKFQGIMLSYAVRFLNENTGTFLYIPVYLLFTLGLVALITWQHCCFASHSASNNYFFDFHNSGLWGILNILEFIWGLQFLRDSFNFCVSGCAVDWYWRGKSNCYEPYQRLLCNHWGSVVGGSFLNAFFEIPTLLAELFICHPQTCCSKLGTCCYNSCSCCSCFFDLVRTDVYSYINLTGIPYCNSARQCKLLCDRSRQYIGTHSAMKHYRFAAHVFCVAAVLLLTYFILKHRVYNFGFWNLAIGVAIIYATLTWFINIHADSAEGLQTCYLAEHELEGHDYMQRCIPSYRNDLKFLQNRKVVDGNC